MKLKANESIFLFKDKVTFDNIKEPIILNHYVLKNDDVNNYLAAYGTELNFFNTFSDEEQTIYTRWIRD